MAVVVIDKIEPKGGEWAGLVDANQVIGLVNTIDVSGIIPFSGHVDNTFSTKVETANTSGYLFTNISNTSGYLNTGITELQISSGNLATGIISNTVSIGDIQYFKTDLIDFGPIPPGSPIGFLSVHLGEGAKEDITGISNIFIGKNTAVGYSPSTSYTMNIGNIIKGDLLDSSINIKGTLITSGNILASGNLITSGNILLNPSATVDGVDVSTIPTLISSTSGSLQNSITNLNLSSGIWTRDETTIFSSGNANVTCSGLVKCSGLYTYKNLATTEPSIRVENEGNGDASINFRLTDFVDYTIGADHTNDLFRISPSSVLDASNSFIMNQLGNFGLGTGPLSTKRLGVDFTPTDSNSSCAAFSYTPSVTSTANRSNYGINLTVESNINRLVSNGGILAGYVANVKHLSSGNLKDLYGCWFNYGVQEIGNIISGNCQGLRFNPLSFTGCTIATMQDIYIGDRIGGGTVTNEWCIYSEHNVPSRFVGDLRIETDGTSTGGRSTWGAANDAAIYYNGTDLIIDSKLVGTGKTIFTDGVTISGNVSERLYYGSMWSDDSVTTVSILASDTYYPIISGFIAGSGNGFTFSSGCNLICNFAGKYSVNWSMTAQCSTPNQYVEGAIMVNSTAKMNTVGAAEIPTVDKKVCLGGCGIISLQNNDVVKFCVENETSANNIVVDHGNMVLQRVDNY